MRSNSRALPIAMILGSCTSLQFGSVYAIMLFPKLGPFAVTSLRQGMAALMMAVVVRPAAHLWNVEQWRRVVLYGLSFAGMNGAFYAAIARIPIGPAVTIEFLGPLTLSAITSRRRLELVCALAAFLGVSLFGVDDLHGTLHLDGWGVVFALVSGVFWAAYILASKRAGQVVQGHGGLVVALMIGSLALLPLGFGGVRTAFANPHLLWDALGCALLSAVVPYSLELSALRRLPHQVFGVLLSLEPAVAAVAGLALLHQGVTLLTVLAIVIVVGASVIGAVLGDPEPEAGPEAGETDEVPIPT